MARSPAMETKRLLLLPFSEEYLTKKYVRWLNDPEVVRFSEQRFKTHTIDSCRAYMLSFEGSPNYFWAILSRNTEEGHIGNINAYVDMGNMVADIGILLGEKTIWGKGYGLEAFVTVIDYLFGVVEVRKVTAGTLSVNGAMVKIMRKAGMSADGIRLRHVLMGNREIDLIHTAMFKDEWRKTRVGEGGEIRGHGRDDPPFHK